MFTKVEQSQMESLQPGFIEKLLASESYEAGQWYLLKTEAYEAACYHLDRRSWLTFVICGNALNGPEIRWCTLRDCDPNAITKWPANRALPLTVPSILKPSEAAGVEVAEYTFDDYATAARVIALHLDEFCDKSLLYPDMIADAARKAADKIASLTAENERMRGAAELARVDLTYLVYGLRRDYCQHSLDAITAALSAAQPEGVGNGE
jgi:hypothetical protein